MIVSCREEGVEEGRGCDGGLQKGRLQSLPSVGRVSGWHSGLALNPSLHLLSILQRAFISSSHICQKKIAPLWYSIAIEAA